MIAETHVTTIVAEKQVVDVVNKRVLNEIVDITSETPNKHQKVSTSNPIRQLALAIAKRSDCSLRPVVIIVADEDGQLSAEVKSYGTLSTTEMVLVALIEHQIIANDKHRAALAAMEIIRASHATDDYEDAVYDCDNVWNINNLKMCLAACSETNVDGCYKLADVSDWHRMDMCDMLKLTRTVHCFVYTARHY